MQRQCVQIPFMEEIEDPAVRPLPLIDRPKNLSSSGIDIEPSLCRIGESQLQNRQMRARSDRLPICIGRRQAIDRE